MQHIDLDNMAYDTEENHEDSRVIGNQWNYIIGTIIIVIVILYLLNQFGCLRSKRHSRRKRTVGRIRRVIQAIAIRRIPRM